MTAAANAKLHAALHAVILEPAHAAVDVGEAATILLSLAMFVGKCSTRPNEIEALDAVWCALLAKEGSR